MGYKDNRHLFFFQFPDNSEEYFRLLQGQGSGRFIHNDEFCILRYGFQNFHYLLICNSQPAYLRFYIDIYSHLPAELFRLQIHLPDRTHAHFRNFPTVKNVFRHRQIRHKTELLIDHGNAEFHRQRGG